MLLPGGFAYGDYLRAGVIARFSPVMRAVAGFAADGGLVLGICNGFQVLAEADLLPGALLRNRGLRFVSREVAIAAGAARHAVHPRARASGGRCGCRSPTARAATSPTTRRSTSWSANGQVLFRYVDADGRSPAARTTGEPERLAARDRRGDQRRRQRRGLMPHPETAVEAILGSDDGLGIIASFVASAAERERAGGPALGRRGRPMTMTAERPRRRRPRCRSTAGSASPTTSSTRSATGWRPRPERPRARDVQRHVERALLVQELAAAAPDAADRTAADGVVAGPGENAGVISIGDGLAVAFKIESHNHPSAVEPYQGAATGVGGILRDIFTMGARPDRGPRRAALRRPGRRPDAPPRRRRRPGRRRLRQLRRRADGRRRARVRPVVPGQPARQRDGDRPARGATT